MRKVHFNPDEWPDDAAKAWWQEWREKAERATLKVIEAWEQWYPKAVPGTKFDYNFDKEIWKELKLWMSKNLFHNKCAYCETPVDLDRFGGDSEHFRPKGNVTIQGENNKKVAAECTFPDGRKMPHPGYFWLAYDWRNLMPACTFCNSSGKVDQFPTTKSHVLMRELMAAEIAELKKDLKELLLESPRTSGKYFLPPRVLNKEEEPGLLCPLNPEEDREPSKHLRYGLGGIVVAVDNSPLGKDSIRVYKLEREGIQERRHDAQDYLERKYSDIRVRSEDYVKEVQRVLAPYKSGYPDYSTAALDGLKEFLRIKREADDSALCDTP